jgi:hypothetical protein
MAVFPFQLRRWLVSLVCTITFLPVYLFWGGVFSFSFTAVGSFWAWGFGITACWSQVLAILSSFLYPRKAAYWMVVNTGISILLAIGHGLLASGTTAGRLVSFWPSTPSGLFKAGMIFWVPPLFFAFLLIRRVPDSEDATVEPSANGMRAVYENVDEVR